MQPPKYRHRRSYEQQDFELDIGQNLGRDQNGFRDLVPYLFGGAMLVAAFAFQLDTTVYSNPTVIGGAIIGGGSTLNLGLLQKQMMIFQVGLVMVIIGAIFVAQEASVHVRSPDRKSTRLNSSHSTLSRMPSSA